MRRSGQRSGAWWRSWRSVGARPSPSPHAPPRQLTSRIPPPRPALLAREHDPPEERDEAEDVRVRVPDSPGRDGAPPAHYHLDRDRAEVGPERPAAAVRVG